MQKINIQLSYSLTKMPIMNNLYGISKYVAEITAVSGFVMLLVGDVAAREAWSGFEFWSGFMKYTGISMLVGGIAYSTALGVAENHFGIAPSCRLPNRTNQQPDLEARTQGHDSDLGSRTD